MQNVTSRHHAGKMAYHGGLAAEEVVARHYTQRGGAVLARRWRGSGGEIDLIVQVGNDFVFVEVKKSAQFAQAALRISPRQRQRIFAAAQEYVANQPAGQLSAMRFDMALVDQMGAVVVLENALATD